MLLIVCRLMGSIFNINLFMKTTLKNSTLIKRCAANLRVVRLRRGLSQEGLAEIADLHRTYVGAVERAERNITLVSLEKLATALGVDPASLLSKSMDD